MPIYNNQMDVFQLIERYTPKKSSDILANQITVKELKKFLADFTNDSAIKMVIVLGPMASCKTSLCTTVFSECNYSAITVNVTNMSGNIRDHIINKLNNRTLEDYFSEKKRVLFLDDVDLLSQYEKGFVRFLIDLIPKLKIPLICTANKIDERKIADLKKKSKELRAKIIYIARPSYSDCFRFIHDIICKEDLTINYEILKHSIKTAKNDIKTVLLNLPICIQPDTATVSDAITIKNAFYDMVNFDIVKRVFEKSINTTEIDAIIAADVYIISLLLYENLLGEYKYHRNVYNKTQLFANYTDILNNYCGADQLEAYLYQTNDYSSHIYEIFNFMKLQAINVNVHSIPIKRQSSNQYHYCSLLSKHAIAYNYSKKKTTLFTRITPTTTYFDFVMQVLIAECQKQFDNEIIDKDVLDLLYKYASTYSLSFSLSSKNTIKKNHNL